MRKYKLTVTFFQLNFIFCLLFPTYISSLQNSTNFENFTSSRLNMLYCCIISKQEINAECRFLNFILCIDSIVNDFKRAEKVFQKTF